MNEISGILIWLSLGLEDRLLDLIFCFLKGFWVYLGTLWFQEEKLGGKIIILYNFNVLLSFKIMIKYYFEDMRESQVGFWVE